MRKPLLMLWLLLLLQLTIAQEAANVWTAFLDDDFRPKGIVAYDKPVKSNIIPFHLNGGLIFFKANLNGMADTFVLDTGSPGLLLNENADKKNKNSFTAVGVNGGLLFQKKSGHLFEMGAFSKREVASLSANLSHLEKVKRQKFRGMVGHELLEQHELFLNYRDGIMRLLEGGALDEVKGMKRTISIPINFQQHFAVLKIKIGNKTYKFGIDTGAEVNIIDERIADRFPEDIFEVVDKIRIRGVSKRGVGADVGKISSFTIAENPVKDMKFVVMNMDILNEGKKIDLDGLLGFPFLSSALFSVDYVSGLLHIWEKEGDVLVDAND